MPVEPVPTRPAGPKGRRAILSAAAPIAALGLVVVAALTGAAVAPRTSEPPAPSPENGRARIAPSGPALPGMDLSVAPRIAFRLAVRSVDATLAARASGQLGDGLVAIAAYLTVDPRVRDCAVDPAVAEQALFCRRLVRLSSRFGTTPAAAGGGSGASEAGRSLRAHVLPGTPLPDALGALVGRESEAQPWPEASVVIGRFGDPRAGACHPPRRQCGDPFVLERVAWIDGRWMDRPAVRDPALPASEAAMSRDLARLLTSRESDRGEVILSEALLTVGLLRDVNPAAAAALGDGTPGRIWYVRSIGRSAVDGHERPIWPVAWAVLDAASGRVLATGEPG